MTSETFRKLFPLPPLNVIPNVINLIHVTLCFTDQWQQWESNPVQLVRQPLDQLEMIQIKYINRYVQHNYDGGWSSHRGVEEDSVLLGYDGKD